MLMKLTYLYWVSLTEVMTKAECVQKNIKSYMCSKGLAQNISETEFIEGKG